MFSAKKAMQSSLVYAAFCGSALSVPMATMAGCAEDEGEAENLVVEGALLSTEGAIVPLPPLPYGDEVKDTDGRTPRVVIGGDGRSFTPWAYPYSTVGQTETGCTATMVGRMVAVTAAHCVQYSTGTITFGRGFNGSHTGESLTTIGWHWHSWGQSSFNNMNSTNDWAILIMDQDPNMGWMGVAWVPLPTSPASAQAYPWLGGWSTGYGASGDSYDNLNRFKSGSISQIGGARYPNWIATYDIEPGDSGSSFVQNSDGRVISIQSAEVGGDGCSLDYVNCINLVSASGAWWNSYIAALNANP